MEVDLVALSSVKMFAGDFLGRNEYALSNRLGCGLWNEGKPNLMRVGVKPVDSFTAHR